LSRKTRFSAYLRFEAEERSVSPESSFYLKQAANCAKEAEAALLPNLREMYRRSEAAWQALADRRLLTEANRARLEEQKRQAVALGSQFE
jgi:hypothetical protein